MGSSSKGKKSGGYRSAGGNRKRSGSVPSRSSEETTTVKIPDPINTNPIFKGYVEPQPLTEAIPFGTDNR